jgi:hypothetical protein
LPPVTAIAVRLQRQRLRRLRHPQRFAASPPLPVRALSLLGLRAGWSSRRRSVVAGEKRGRAPRDRSSRLIDRAHKAWACLDPSLDRRGEPPRRLEHPPCVKAKSSRSPSTACLPVCRSSARTRCSCRSVPNNDRHLGSLGTKRQDDRTLGRGLGVGSGVAFFCQSGCGALLFDDQEAFV